MGVPGFGCPVSRFATAASLPRARSPPSLWAGERFRRAIRIVPIPVCVIASRSLHEALPGLFGPHPVRNHSAPLLGEDERC